MSETFAGVKIPAPEDGNFNLNAKEGAYCRLWLERADSRTGIDLPTVKVEPPYTDSGREDVEPLAQEIARRWNAHPALLAALEEALAGLNRLHEAATSDGSIVGDAAFRVVEDALALARGA